MGGAQCGVECNSASMISTRVCAVAVIERVRLCAPFAHAQFALPLRAVYTPSNALKDVVIADRLGNSASLRLRTSHKTIRTHVSL